MRAHYAREADKRAKANAALRHPLRRFGFDVRPARKGNVALGRGHGHAMLIGKRRQIDLRVFAHQIIEVALRGELFWPAQRFNLRPHVCFANHAGRAILPLMPGVIVVVAEPHFLAIA